MEERHEPHAGRPSDRATDPSLSARARGLFVGRADRRLLLVVGVVAFVVIGLLAWLGRGEASAAVGLSQTIVQQS